MNSAAALHTISDVNENTDLAQRKRTHGHVIHCDGREAVLMARVDPNVTHLENYWAVGQLVSIWEGQNRVVGQTYRVESHSPEWAEGDENRVVVHIELVGEITQKADGSASFSSGIANYPKMGAIGHRIRAKDLEAIYENKSDNTILIGNLTQETSIPAKIDLDKLLSRHFSVVGSTGVGKSTAVSLILRKIIERRKDIRVLIIDPHNEFTAAFKDESVVKDSSNLQLPFWLFMYEEFAEVVFRGQKGNDAESELLRDLVAEAKERYTESNNPNQGSLVRRGGAKTGFTADSPVPYRLLDLFKIIDEKLGLLDGKADRPILKSLKDRLTSISRDPRFAFMFATANTGGDRMAEIIADIFRVPHNDKQISVVDMSGLPSEVVNSVCAVLCRLAFDIALSSQGGIQTLVVCEEAHRYIPADPDAGFWPTRQSIARIAKEGRKYGVYLGIITQRPSELDSTILSQCNTVFAMRLANQADQKIIGGAMTNGAQSSVAFLASIANRECIAFGEALKTPMRLTFETISKDLLPGSHIYEMQEKVRNGLQIDIGQVVRRMREADNKQPVRGEEEEGSISDLAALERPAPQRGEASSPTPGQRPTPSHGGTGFTPGGAGFSHGERAASTAQRPPVLDESTPTRQAEPMFAPRPWPDRAAAPRPAGGGNTLINSFRSKS
ncbi:MAG: DUF87 domain-containing protein [Rhizobiaceae bacterium]